MTKYYKIYLDTNEGIIYSDVITTLDEAQRVFADWMNQAEGCKYGEIAEYCNLLHAECDMYRFAKVLTHQEGKKE